MAAIDSYFTRSNINFDALLADFMICMNHSFMKPAVIKSVNYLIPARDELNPVYDYVRINIHNKIISNIMNLFLVKSRFADIKEYIDAEVTLDPADYIRRDVNGVPVELYDENGNLEDTTHDNLVMIGLHGRNIFINNTDKDTVITIQYSEIEKAVSSLYEEIYRYIKQAYYYALTSDYNSMYQSLTLLSNAKSNVKSKNVHVEKDRRSNQVFNIKLFKI